VFTGCGSLLSERLRDRRRGLVAALAAVTALVTVAAFALQPLLRALIDLPFAARIVIAVALLAPAGLLLGIAMPVGLQRLAALHPTGVAWAWGINGVTSVLGSVLAIFVAINWGFTVATLLAAACYALAAGHARLGRWP
jgi:sugar phosphate permease